MLEFVELRDIFERLFPQIMIAMYANSISRIIGTVRVISDLIILAINLLSIKKYFLSLIEEMS